MQEVDAAAALEAILRDENAALERNDAATAVALLDRKLAATKALDSDAITSDQLECLRDLAERNRTLLQRAIDVQTQIVDMVVRAAQGAPHLARYGAAGRTVRHEGAVAIARQA